VSGQGLTHLRQAGVDVSVGVEAAAIEAQLAPYLKHRRTGRPLVVPVCYAFDGRTCVTAIDAKPKRVAPRALRRVRNIADNPQVSLVVDRYDEDWSQLRWVIVQGRADILGEGPERATAVDLLRAKFPQYRAMGLDRDITIVIRISPERTTYWSWKS